MGISCLKHAFEHSRSRATRPTVVCASPKTSILDPMLQTDHDLDNLDPILRICRYEVLCMQAPYNIKQNPPRSHPTVGFALLVLGRKKVYLLTG